MAAEPADTDRTDAGHVTSLQGGNDSSPYESILSSVSDNRHIESSMLERFLSADSPGNALRIWFAGQIPKDKDTVVRSLLRHIADIDDALNDQINAIIHHPVFQKLESSWRGLRFLVARKEEEGDPGVHIKVFNASWKDLERDFERALEFDQSQLFRKIYDQEFGTPGGEPYGVLIGDYEVRPRPLTGHPHDDVGILQKISQVAAAAFCPFILGANPGMFGMDNFSTLEHRLDHAKTFEQLDYVKWRAFRDTEDARFIGLTLPHVLMRLPYQDDGTRLDGFQFREDVSGPDNRKYLWGNAAFGFGAVLIRTFAQNGWLADIRGVQRGLDGGGLVESLSTHSFATDRIGVAVKSATDVVITDELEKELSELGFIPLCNCQDTEFSAFYSNSSAQKPKAYDRAAATANAKISSMLQYMFCVSRFAHYIKVLGRGKVGAFANPEDFESYLQRWVVGYVTTDMEATPAVKARFPLREAKVQVREQPGKPGAYQCVMHLAPHYELDDLTAAIRITTELAPPRIA